MRLIFVLLLLSVFCISSANAQNNTVKRGPLPSWVEESELIPLPENPQGLAFFRRQDTLVHLDQEGQQHFVSYRIKVLHSNALQFGNLSIVWNPVSGSPIAHRIQIYRGAEIIDVLENAKFEILRREDQLEAAKLDGMLTAVLRIPDLRIGDELEVSTTTPYKDPTLGTKSSGFLMLSSDPAQGRFRLGLSWEAGQKPQIKMTPEMSAAAKQLPDSVQFNFDNPKLLSAPNDAPPRYQWQRYADYSNFADWQAMSRHFAPLYAKASVLDTNSAVKKEADRIAAAHTAPLERAKAALKLVQADTRYIYVGLNGGNLTPAKAEDTWQRRYGDCKGKTVLLLALLKELGVEAEPVLVSNSGIDDGLNDRLPITNIFDHILVRARIDGSTYWLDGTLPIVAQPTQDPVFAYRWVLPLSEEGRALEAIEWRPQNRPDTIELNEIDASAGFDQPAKFTNTIINRGVTGIQQYFQFSALTQDQLLQAFQKQSLGEELQTVDNVQWRYDEKAQASILTIMGTKLIDWDDDGDGTRSFALPGGGFFSPSHKVRPANQDQTAPYYTKPSFNCHVTSIRFPRKANAENWTYGDNIDTHIFGLNYYRIFELHDGVIRMIRASRVDKTEIDLDSAKQDNARISSFDNSMGWIFYDPSSKERRDKNDTQVLTNYEKIDWTQNDTPCLPAKSR